jgi:hypothetical protein
MCRQPATLYWPRNTVPRAQRAAVPSFAALRVTTPSVQKNPSALVHEVTAASLTCMESLVTRPVSMQSAFPMPTYGLPQYR